MHQRGGVELTGAEPPEYTSERERELKQSCLLRCEETACHGLWLLFRGNHVTILKWHVDIFLGA